MEQEVLKFLFEYIKGLQIKNCDTYINHPTILGDGEKRNRSYVVIALPNGIEYLDAYCKANGMITIGAKDKEDVLGLPSSGEITRISKILKEHFPILTDDYSVINFEFSSDDSRGIGWHEYYYTFQLYINKSN